MIQSFGIIGALLMAICGVPQALMSWRRGTSCGISQTFVWTWLIGEIFLFLYVGLTTIDVILLVNYAVNIMLVSIIMFYLYFPRKGC